MEVSDQIVPDNISPVSDLPPDEDMLFETEEELMQQEEPPPSEEQDTLKKRRKRFIIQLIETVQQLKEVYRPITSEEHELIHRWPGWGAYRLAFEEDPPESWQAVGPQLRALLGPQGYDAASTALLTSYFTDTFIGQAIWHLAERLGFSGGTVLEPGCGTGQILAQAPSTLDLQITGIEMEPFTASVAQLLFPQAHIINAPIQDVALTEGAFDLVVGNVPFADVPIYDRTLPFKEKLTLHNYCIYRALAALRPGGIALLVTTHYTMDATTTSARKYLGELGILLGAIRLPSSGHKWAKTAVITDILVLQRRYSDSEDAWKGHNWVTPATFSIHGVEMETSTYYAHHSEQILGTVIRGRGQYRDDEILIKAPNDLEGALDAAIERIANDAARHKSTYIPRLDPRHLDETLVAMRGDGLKEGCFYLLKEGLVEIVHGHPNVVTRLVDELTELVRLRDVALGLLEAERDYSKTDEQLVPLRHELNRRYDAYVKRYGPIRRSALVRHVDKETGEEKITRRLPMVMYAFRTDEQYPLVLSLEIYDDETQKAKKAKIFSQRVNYPAVYKEKAESREEAIALSLDRYGHLNFAFIAQATGQQEETVAQYLGDLVFEDPQQHRFEIAPNYLSGNVRYKLDIAHKALLSDPKWQRNVDALEKVQPEPIPPEDIKVLLGAPWIPVSHIQRFCEQTFGIKPAIARDRVSGSWDVSPHRGPDSRPLFQVPGAPVGSVPSNWLSIS